MDQNHFTMDTLRKKGAHLTFEERVIIHVQKRLQEHHWSLDACFGRALVTGEFQRGEMVCTKTLYNYVTLGLLGKIKSIDLPLRIKRKNARKRGRKCLQHLLHKGSPGVQLIIAIRAVYPMDVGICI